MFSKLNIIPTAFLVLAVLTAGCGSDSPADPPEPVPTQEVIVFKHSLSSNNIPPIAEAIAAAEGTSVVAGADGSARVSLSDSSIEVVVLSDHDAIMQRMQNGSPPAAVLFVVSGADGSFDAHKTQLQAAQAAGVPVAAAMMSSIHLVDDAELLDLVEQFDIGETLTDEGYPGVQVVRASAVRAVEGSEQDLTAIRQITQLIRQAVGA